MELKDYCVQLHNNIHSYHNLHNSAQCFGYNRDEDVAGQKSGNTLHVPVTLVSIKSKRDSQ